MTSRSSSTPSPSAEALRQTFVKFCSDPDTLGSFYQKLEKNEPDAVIESKKEEASILPEAVKEKTEDSLKE